MEIKLIKRELKNGRTSLVLEYYLGYTLGANGTTRPKRKFETLEYFLYTAPRNKAERDHNKINLEMAEKVKAKRLLAEQNEQYGFAVPFKIRTNLVEFIRGMVEQRKDSPGNWGNWDSMLKHLIAYAGTETTFERIDRRFVEGFRTYLAKEARTKSGTALSANSQNSYFLKFKAALNRAVEEGIVPQSPAMGVKATRTEDVHREYLTIEELQRLVKTDCSYPVLKDAFIFSCLTGMRWSDINKLTWGEVQEFDGGTRVVFRQKKTRGLEYLDISEQAVRYMGPRGRADEREFARFGDSERRCGKFAAFFDGEPVGSFGFRSHDGVVFLSGRQNPGQRSGVCLRGGVPTACEWLSGGRGQSRRAIRLSAAYRPGPAIQSSAKAARQSMFDAFVWFSQIDGLSLRP